jgi:protease PrsW
MTTPQTAPSTDRTTPRWGFDGSFFQLRRPAFWLFAALLLVGLDKFAGMQLALMELPTAYLTSWGLVLLYAVPVAFIVNRIDLFEREPIHLLIAAVIWGGVIATSLAIYANDGWGSVVGKVAPTYALDWGAAIVAPPVEEILKLAGVVVLWLIVAEEFDGTLDGFVYGAMVGLGFTVVEDVMYFMSSVYASGIDQNGPVFDSFFIRVIGGGLYGHVLFAGLTGMGFAYFVTSKATFRRRLAWFAGCFAAAYAAHSFWNSPLLNDVLANGGDAPGPFQVLAWCTLKGLPFLVVLVVLVVFATRSEERSFRAVIADEPDETLLPEADVRALGSLWSRRSARVAAGRRLGPAGTRLTGQLQSAQVEYARVRSTATTLDSPEVEAARRRIAAVRAQLAALEGAPARVAGGVAGWPGAVGSPAGAGGRSGAVVAAGAAPTWTPTHVVPAGGAPAWLAPDPSQPPVLGLAPGLELALEGRLHDWALVRASNGWRGWVDGRLLVVRAGA